MGDSITFGAGVKDRHLNSYPVQLGKIHPNAAGAGVMAKTIAEVLKTDVAKLKAR